MLSKSPKRVEQNNPHDSSWPQQDRHTNKSWFLLTAILNRIIWEADVSHEMICSQQMMKSNPDWCKAQNCSDAGELPWHRDDKAALKKEG